MPSDDAPSDDAPSDNVPSDDVPSDDVPSDRRLDGVMLLDYDAVEYTGVVPPRRLRIEPASNETDKE